MIPTPQRSDIPPDQLRADFAREFNVHPGKWSAYNLSRMLNAAGMTRDHKSVTRSVLAKLGLDGGNQGDYAQHWITRGGVFDHGEMWLSKGLPKFIVGHPYDIDKVERNCLGDLIDDSRFNGLRVHVDDRPSYYGFGTHHVRIELAGHPDASPVLAPGPIRVFNPRPAQQPDR